MINPLLSITIPSFNRDHLISEALDSVLDQTYAILKSKNIHSYVGQYDENKSLTIICTKKYKYATTF